MYCTTAAVIVLNSSGRDARSGAEYSNINIIAGNPDQYKIFVVNDRDCFSSVPLFCVILDAISVKVKARADVNSNKTAH